MERSEVAPEDVASWREYRLVVDGALAGRGRQELWAPSSRASSCWVIVTWRPVGITGVFDLRRPLEALHAWLARSQRFGQEDLRPYQASGLGASKPVGHISFERPLNSPCIPPV